PQRRIGLERAAEGLHRAGLVAQAPLGDLAELVGSEREALPVALALELGGELGGARGRIVGDGIGGRVVDDRDARLLARRGAMRRGPVVLAADGQPGGARAPRRRQELAGVDLLHLGVVCELVNLVGFFARLWGHGGRTCNHVGRYPGWGGSRRAQSGYRPVP